MTETDLRAIPRRVDRRELLARMDANWVEMTRTIVRATPGGFVVERGGLVMCGTPLGTVVSNMAIVVGPTDAATVRREVTATFAAAGLPFTVWMRHHDAGDVMLAGTLADDGFFPLLESPGMTFHEGDGTPEPAPADLHVRPVTDADGLAAYGDVMAAAYGVYDVPPESMRAHFQRMASVVGATVQAFLAWRGAEAVAGAILYESHGVGGIGWVGTRPDRFGRGYGAAVTWAVVHEGLRRGARFLTLQASPMGAPVYRRMGFAEPTRYRAFALAG